MFDSDIVAVVAHKAPTLIKTGGGALEQEIERNFLTPKLEKKLRELAKMPLNQREIGERLGVHQAQVSRWLKKFRLKATGARKSPQNQNE